MESIMALLIAAIGGLIGTYFGAHFLNKPQKDKMKEVRGIAIKALNILKRYSKQSYRNSENEFNTSLSLVEKRTVLVALHKLGIPIGIPSDESFNIRKVYFIDTVVDNDDIEGIISQVEHGYCDHLFYLDPDTHFTANYALYALRNAAKKYVNEVLAKSTLDRKQNLMTSPPGWELLFSLGELKPILVFKDQVNIPLNFNNSGSPNAEKIKSLVKEIDLGLWDYYLMWNYEAYQNAKNQILMGEYFSSLAMSPQSFIPTGQSNRTNAGKASKGKHK